jgi:hypothetical protein
MTPNPSPGDAPSVPKPLTNSQRRLYKATYRPLTFPPEQQQATGRFLEKLAFVRDSISGLTSSCNWKDALGVRKPVQRHEARGRVSLLRSSRP